MEPAVRLPFAGRPPDCLLQQRDRLARATERSQRLADCVAGDLDRASLLRFALACLERALECVERELVFAGVVVLPAEVVEQRAGPVRGGLVLFAELDPALVQSTKPSRSGATSAAMCAASAAMKYSSAAERRFERRLEERTSGFLVAARASQPSALEVDASASVRARRRRALRPRRGARRLRRTRRAARRRARAASAPRRDPASVPSSSSCARKRFSVPSRSSKSQSCLRRSSTPRRVLSPPNTLSSVELTVVPSVDALLSGALLEAILDAGVVESGRGATTTPGGRRLSWRASTATTPRSATRPRRAARAARPARSRAPRPTSR